MSELKVIADYQDLCGEGPIWDEETDRLYWTDASGKRFYCYDWPGQRHWVMQQGTQINSVSVNIAGGYVITNPDGFWFWDGEEHFRLIANQAEGFPCKLNDSIADPEGRIFSGSVFYDPNKPSAEAKLFRLDNDGTVKVVDEGHMLSNGLGFSPDLTMMYYTDSAAKTIYAYDYSRTTGDIRNRRVFVKCVETDGLPDGMHVDAEGFVWSANWYGGCVIRYDPDGREERRIATPAKQTSSLTFGGPELTDMFITSAGFSEPMAPLMPPGYDYVNGYFGGALYHINLGIQGRLEFKANIRPPR